MRRKTLITCAVTAAVCVLTFLLPDLLLAIRDRAVSSRVETLEADEVELSLLSELSPSQRFRLAGDTTATVFPLSSGRSMDTDGAIKHAYELLPITQARVVQASATLKVASDGSGMVLWRVSLTEDSWTHTLIFDDTTGYLLGVELDISQEYLDRYGTEEGYPPPEPGREWPTTGDLFSTCLSYVDFMLSQQGLWCDEDGMSIPTVDTFLFRISTGDTLTATVSRVNGIHIRINA